MSNEQHMDRQELAAAIYRTAHLTGTFRLRSGATSSEYFDKYRFESSPRLLATIAAALAGLVPSSVEALGGLELGGVALATQLSQVTGLPTLFVRKAAKPYGTCQLAEGGAVKGRHILLVEDVSLPLVARLSNPPRLSGLWALWCPMPCASSTARRAGLQP